MSKTVNKCTVDFYLQENDQLSQNKSTLKRYTYIIDTRYITDTQIYTRTKSLINVLNSLSFTYFSVVAQAVFID